MGIGIPVDLDIETVTIGYVFKADFYLPDNASDVVNIFGDPFDVSTHPISTFLRKRRSSDKPIATENAENHNGFDTVQNERFEKHKVEAEIVESGVTNEPSESDLESDGLLVPENNEYRNDPMASKIPQNTRKSRWTLYEGMATIAERFY